MGVGAPTAHVRIDPQDLKLNTNRRLVSGTASVRAAAGGFSGSPSPVTD